jgi:heavy metal sensor kinase
MNTKSLRFRLFSWYVALVLGSFTLVAGASYLALDRSLTGAMRHTQFRRAVQVGNLLQEELREGVKNLQERVRREIEVTLAPGHNNRFVRITGEDGAKVYESEAPLNRSFDPESVPAPQWPPGTNSTRFVSTAEGQDLMLVSRRLNLGTDGSYLVETAAPLAEVRSELRKWAVFLVSVLPTLGVITLAGGFVLVNRALSPVDRITASAERISSQNLSERLPVSQTGDELERLSVALNHMIERLDAAFQHSRRFVADASHELRTPLTVLRGNLEEVVEQPQLSGDWRDRLGSALEEVDRLVGIVEGLFAISRLDAGEAAAEWVRFDFSKLAADTTDQLSLLAEDKRIRLSCSAGQPVWVEGDRARMKQVVVNLLDNALKYTPEGGVVNLTVAARDNRAVMEVSDTGPGIPQELLNRVFERFFRLDKARSREGGGAGLGLSIVRSICAAHHGRVELTSVVGEGSCFRVELPLAQEAQTNHNQLMTYAH